MEFEAKNILNLPNVSNQQDILVAAKAMANSLADIAKKDRPFNEPREWRTVQSLVRLGLAPQFFNVGDQLQCNHEVFGTLTWDIIDFDYDIPCDEEGNMLTTVGDGGEVIPAHSMTLALHNTLDVTIRWGESTHTWDDSYMKKWLNSNDIVSKAHTTIKGFMYGLDPDFSAVLSTILKSSVISKNMKIFKEKVFLPSGVELHGLDVPINYGASYMRDSVLLLSKDPEVLDNKLYYQKDSNGFFTQVVTPSGSPAASGWYESKRAYKYFSPPYSTNLNPTNDVDLNRIKSTVNGVKSCRFTRTIPDANQNQVYGVYSPYDGKIISGAASMGDSLKTKSWYIAPCITIA